MSQFFLSWYKFTCIKHDSGAADDTTVQTKSLHIHKHFLQTLNSSMEI